MSDTSSARSSSPPTRPDRAVVQGADRREEVFARRAADEAALSA